MSFFSPLSESFVSSFVANIWHPTANFDPKKDQYYQLAISWSNYSTESILKLAGLKEDVPRRINTLETEFDLCFEIPSTIDHLTNNLLFDDKPSVITTKNTPENKHLIEQFLCRIATILEIEREEVTTYPVGPFMYHPDNIYASNEAPFGTYRTSKAPCTYFKPHCQEILYIDYINYEKWEELEEMRTELEDKYDIYIQIPKIENMENPGTIYISDDKKYVNNLNNIMNEISKRLKLPYMNLEQYNQKVDLLQLGSSENYILTTKGSSLTFDPNEVWTDYEDDEY
jgi:hypothetical protein